MQQSQDAKSGLHSCATFHACIATSLLKAWTACLQSLTQRQVSTFERDQIVLAILPIFHHPHITAPMRIHNQDEVQRLAGLFDHVNQVRTHKPLLTEMTVRNYCGNSFHPDNIQAAIGHPERLRSWLASPVQQPPTFGWQRVIHPKQVRTQYHTLCEQVKQVAQTQKTRDIHRKQVGLDSMPDFPVHNLEGKLTPVLPTISPTQILPNSRKITHDELGLTENKPPAQLSAKALQMLEQQNMHDLVQGMLPIHHMDTMDTLSFPMQQLIHVQ